MKKIIPGIGNRAKRYRKPSETLVGAGKVQRKRRSKKSKRSKKHGRKRDKSITQ